MSRLHERTAARRMAAQILYSGQVRNKPALELLESGEISCLDGSVSDYTYSLVKGVEENIDQLDSELSESSRNWAIGRMPIMDLAILRIALYEMLFVDQVPISVSINEAVEMAKEFGGDDDSPKFINGILGNIARKMEGEPASE